MSKQTIGPALMLYQHSSRRVRLELREGPVGGGVVFYLCDTRDNSEWPIHATEVEPLITFFAAANKSSQ